MILPSRLPQALLLVLLLTMETAVAAPKPAPVTLNLKDADISALIASVAEITGKNFIVDPRVHGKVTVVSSHPLAADQVYSLFLSILAVHGYAAIPGKTAIKIVPANTAKQDDIPNSNGRSSGGPDQMVTRVIQVHNINVTQLVPLLRPLVPPDGHLAAYAPGNVLVISDRAGNVARIAQLVARMDQASRTNVEMVPLHHARADQVASLLNALVTGPRGKGQTSSDAPKLVADERSNSILLRGDASDRRRLRRLIERLDTPHQAIDNTQVIYLHYARAKNLLPVLRGLSKQLRATDTGQNGSKSPPATGDSQIDIQADTATNALVLDAPPDAMHSLKAVIKRLDVRRAQVLVEAAIVEISSDKAAELGVQWLIDGSKNGTGAGYTNFQSPGFNGLSVGELAGAIANKTIPSPLPSGLNAIIGDTSGSTRFGALISALASNADTNILSTPTLVTLDNQEAQIVVGQNVPFVTGTFTTTTGGNSGSTGNPFQTIERKDVGLTLDIKPHINQNNSVQLDISQEVSQVVPTATALTLAQGPTTNKRQIKTSVQVESGQILVLGGLIDNTLSSTVQKVPGLGDLPFIGNLFRYRQTSKSKRNLMIFLHPVILRAPAAGTAASQARYDAIREQQQAARQRGVDLLPGADTPKLPSTAAVHQQGTLNAAPATPPERSSPPTSPPAGSTITGNTGFGRK